MNKYYQYTPVTWETDAIVTDPFNKEKYYKVEQIDRVERRINRRYEIPQTSEDFNIQLWITETDLKSTTEMGIDQENGIIRPFLYCTDTWHKDVWRQNGRYVQFDPLEGELPSMNRILKYIEVPVPTIGTLEFQFHRDRVYGFLDNQFFGEIMYSKPDNFNRISYGLEVYAPIIVPFISYKPVVQNVYYRKA